MPIQLNSASGSIVITAEDGSGSASLTLPRAGLGTVASKDTGTGSGNIPILDGSGKLNNSVLNAIALTAVQTAANESAQLALTAQEGDIVVRSDENKTYCHNGGSAGTMSDYTLLATPTDAVTSVNGSTGVVTISVGDGGLTTNDFTNADHSKLNAIEASADVTDATNVTAAGALMDSEVTNLAAVKAFATSDYATAAQGTTADNALPKAGGAMTGAITTNSTFDGVDIAVRDAILTSTTTTAGAALPKAGGTMTGTTVLKGITETQLTKSASFTPTFADGTVYSCTGTMTITMPTATAGKAFTIIHATATSITWAGTIKWTSATAPTADSGIDIYTFISDGTNWYGMQAGTGMA